MDFLKIWHRHSLQDVLIGAIRSYFNLSKTSVDEQTPAKLMTVPPASGVQTFNCPCHVTWIMFFPWQALSNKSQHSISYTLSRSHSVIVEYTHDTNTDMFQVSVCTNTLIHTHSHIWSGLWARVMHTQHFSCLTYHRIRTLEFTPEACWLQKCKKAVKSIITRWQNQAQIIMAKFYSWTSWFKWGYW